MCIYNSKLIDSSLFLNVLPPWFKMSVAPYRHRDVYVEQSTESQSGDESQCVPRVFISPGKYIQGQGVFRSVGRYLSKILGSKSVLLLITEGGLARSGEALCTSLELCHISVQTILFNGECCLSEVDRITTHAASSSHHCTDCVVGVGGGKLVDTAKCVAHRLGVAAVICPSLASNDAPCSALSIMYSENGKYLGGEVFPLSPALVVVDTSVIAKSPVRYLVSGMGDAMATW